MNFKDILIEAQQGCKPAINEILTRYQPMLAKYSIHEGIFDEDLYQELCMTLLNCIRKFRV